MRKKNAIRACGATIRVELLFLCHDMIYYNYSETCMRKSSFNERILPVGSYSNKLKEEESYGTQKIFIHQKYDISPKKCKAVEQVGVLFSISGCNSQHGGCFSGNLATVLDSISATGGGIFEGSDDKYYRDIPRDAGK